jgi:hypothetical protein
MAKIDHKERLGVPGMRLIKWVGDAPMLREDGWRVANWAYETRRVIPVPGKSTRRIRPKDIPGLSREYVWGRVGGNDWDLIQAIDPIDADLIMAENAREFKDVTGHPDPLSVRQDPVIIYPHPTQPGKFLRSR